MTTAYIVIIVDWVLITLRKRKVASGEGVEEGCRTSRGPGVWAKGSTRATSWLIERQDTCIHSSEFDPGSTIHVCVCVGNSYFCLWW